MFTSRLTLTFAGLLVALTGRFPGLACGARWGAAEGGREAGAGAGRDRAAGARAPPPRIWALAGGPATRSDRIAEMMAQRRERVRSCCGMSLAPEKKEEERGETSCLECWARRLRVPWCRDRSLALRPPCLPAQGEEQSEIPQSDN